MEANNDKNIINFTHLLNSWKDTYKTVIVSYLELKTDQGSKLLYGRVIFSSIRPDIENFKFETNHISAVRLIANVDEATVDSYLLKAKIGEIAISDKDKNPTLEKDAHLSTYFIPPLSSEEMRFPSIRFSGIAKHNLISKTVELRQLDSELKSAHQPFDTLDDLLIFCGLPNLSQMGDSTALDIIAITPAFVRNDSKIDNNKLIIKCLAAKDIDKEKLRIGFRIFKGKQVERKSKIGTSFRWRKEKGFIVGTLKMPMKNSSILQTYLSYKDICIYQWWITDPSKLLNPRLGMHEIFEKNLEALKTILTDVDTEKAPQFEGAVATLLHLLGFSVVNYGRIPKLQRGPDIIAITPQGSIGVVECTVGLLDEKDKLAKLVQRTNLIRSRMKDIGYGHLDIQSAIVTPLSREEIKANLEDAAKHGIAVISKENIEELLKRVNMPLDPEALFKEAKTLVPSINSASPAPTLIDPLIAR